MVGKFLVIDTIRKHYPQSSMGPERTDYKLICQDQGECPMHVMPQYLLDGNKGEVESYSGGQLNNKSVMIEVRSMTGRGNPTMTGRIVGLAGNGELKKEK